MPASDLAAYARAVPLNALLAHGLGSGRPRPSATDAEKALAALRRSWEGSLNAIDSAGRTGRQLLALLALCRGAVTRAELERQTATAPPGAIDALVARLEAADLVTTGPGDRVSLHPSIADRIGNPSLSLEHPNAITNEELAVIQKQLGLPVAGRKSERIAAIAGVLGDPVHADLVRANLSAGALELLDRIASCGPGPVPSDAVGLSGYLVRSVSLLGSRYATPPHDARLAMLRELVHHGLVGVAPWEEELWIWREAWPALDRPYYQDWASVGRPEVVAVDPVGPRLPAVVSALDQALRHWESSPPPALKNSEPRLAKTEVRTVAKAIKADPDVVEVGVRLAIAIGLLLRNVVGRSGRGRNARVDEVWLTDPPLFEAWFALSPPHRWAKLVEAWCRPAPGFHGADEVVVNRHLVLGELLALADGQGFADPDAFAAWFGDRFAIWGSASIAREAIDDLRALGIVTEAGVGLTTLGRALLVDPQHAIVQPADESATAIVQSDLTIITPPDVSAEVLATLDSVAALESSAGALTYRLDPVLVTRAVQGGRTEDEVIDFLADLSAAPLPDTVVRLVRDAADRAGAVRLLVAPTVVAVRDPADLAMALSIKSLRLTAVSATVAVTEVAHAKVRAALEKKGLAPDLVVATAATASRRSSAEEAASTAKRAQVMRDLARSRSRSGAPAGSIYEQEADRLEARARALADLDGRLAVHGPLTFVSAPAPALAVEADGPAGRSRGETRGTAAAARRKGTTRKAAPRKGPGA